MKSACIAAFFVCSIAAAGVVQPLTSAAQLLIPAAGSTPGVNGTFFRSNIAIEGSEPWQELDWMGRTIRIGHVELEVVRLKVRCLATHANPSSGLRDLPIMTTLTSAFGQERPTFGVGVIPTGAGGEIRVGDEVQVVG